MDFIRPRLAAPKKRINQRLILAGSIAGACLLVGTGALLYDAQQQSGVLTQAQAELATLKPASDQAAAAKKRLDYVDT